MENEGRYLYGVAQDSRTISLGRIGIGDSEVYTIASSNFCAIVHDCLAEPYQSNDAETVQQWVKQHQNVLDRAKQEFGTVVPMGFDTILHSKDSTASPDKVVQDWLKEDAARLRALVTRIRDKDEYGVQILYAPDIIAGQIAAENREIRQIKEEMATKSAGIAYMYKQKVEKAVQAEMERLADAWFKDFYTRVKGHCDDIVVEKTKKADNHQVMMTNFSCLVARGKVDNLGEELENIDRKEGFFVRFSGPWPPYSFVDKPVVPMQEGAS